MTSIVWHKPHRPPKVEDWYLTTVTYKGSPVTIPAIYVPDDLPDGGWFTFDSYNEFVPLQNENVILIAWAELPPPYKTKEAK